jgi:hypothetical protein
MESWLLILLVVLLAFLVLLLCIALLILLRRLRARRDQPPPPERKVPSAIAPAQLDRLLGARIAGTPADGSAPSDASPDKVIWVDYGDEVLVHLDSLRTAVVGDSVLVSLDLETDETGRAAVVVPFAVGSGPDGGFTFVTEELPRGPEILVRRWGAAVQEAADAALLDLAGEHASERSGRPGALYVKDGQLRLLARTGR